MGVVVVGLHVGIFQCLLILWFCSLHDCTALCSDVCSVLGFWVFGTVSVCFVCSVLIILAFRSVVVRVL